MTDVNEQIRQVAFEYGKAIGWREYYGVGDGSLQIFDEMNARCGQLWRELIALGAYADDEHSVFKEQYRLSYLEGLDASPIRPSGYDFYGYDYEEPEDEWGDD
jgi:hypothetical protein